MAAYLVGAVEIHDPKGYERYRDGVAAAIAPFDCEILSADAHPDVLEGAQPASHLFIVRFASVEECRAFYRSDAYRGIVGFRHAASNTPFLMIMRGLDDIAD